MLTLTPALSQREREETRLNRRIPIRKAMGVVAGLFKGNLTPASMIPVI